MRELLKRMRRGVKEPLQGALAAAAVRGLDRRMRTIEEIRALEPERVVVSRTDRIGDLLVSSVMIAALGRRWPRARLVVVGGPGNRAALDGMPFAEPGPLFQRDPRSWAPLRRWLAAQRFDLAMSLQAESVAGAMIAAWSRAPVRMITHPTKVSAAFNFEFGPEERHHVTRFCHAAERLGAPCIERRPVFEVPPASRERARDIARGWREGEGGGGGGRVVAIQIPNRTTSRHASRAWPEERIRGLARELSDRGRRVVLFAFGVERPEAERIRAALARVEIAPPLPLLDAAALVAEVDVFVSGYTGMYHVADAVGTRTVLIGSTHYAEYWRALGVNHRQALAATAQDVPVAAVDSAVEGLLA